MNNASKRILVIDGNPKTESLSQALALHYAQGAEGAGHHVQRVHLHRLQFQPDLPLGLDVPPPLEPDLQQLQELIQAADHLVWAYPVWWGSVPARLKALLDRLLLPGFAFRYEKGQALPQRLLRGRSARLLVCMDTPSWYFRWVQRAPAHRMMKHAVLEFCGVAPVHISEFTPVIQSHAAQRQRWLQQAAALGAAGA